MADAVVSAGAGSRVPLVRVGTIVWLSSEVMFFGALFAAYFTIRAAATAWPPPGVELDAGRAGAFTLVLVASSVTAQVGVRGAERGDRKTLTRWYAASAVLGAIFLTNQVLEWRGNDFTASSHAYGSLYYLMTGLHGLHVAAGIVALLAVSARPREAGAMAVGYYWHFVDVVWIALYATLFLVR